MVAELEPVAVAFAVGCSLAKISMVAEQLCQFHFCGWGCSLAKISMVAEHGSGGEGESLAL